MLVLLTKAIINISFKSCLVIIQSLSYTLYITAIKKFLTELLIHKL